MTLTNSIELPKTFEGLEANMINSLNDIIRELKELSDENTNNDGIDTVIVDNELENSLKEYLQSHKETTNGSYQYNR